MHAIACIAGDLLAGAVRKKHSTLAASIRIDRLPVNSKQRASLGIRTCEHGLSVKRLNSCSFLTVTGVQQHLRAAQSNVK
jgi:hypothetical protein